MLTQPPVFQRSAYCVLWNYMRRNVLWQEIISTHQRPGNRLQHFTFIKAIRGSVRLDNRNFFLWKLHTDDSNYLILHVGECIMNCTASRNLGQPRLRSWQWLERKSIVINLLGRFIYDRGIRQNIFSATCNLVPKYLYVSQAKSPAIVWDSLQSFKPKAYVACNSASWGKCQFCMTRGNRVCHSVTQPCDSRGTSECCGFPFPKLGNPINSPLQIGLLGLSIHFPRVEWSKVRRETPCECRLSVNRSGTEFLKIWLCLYSPLCLMDSLL